MTGNGEGASSRAETVFFPGDSTPVYVGCAIIPRQGAQRFSGNTGWNHSSLDRLLTFAVTRALRFLLKPSKSREETGHDYDDGLDPQHSAMIPENSLVA